MEIRDLASTPLDQLVDCLLRAFENYFVPMPTELSVWEQRFARSGVDWARSYGAFHHDELVAFIIHALGDLNGERVAFNTGTGVVPERRGQRLVDQLYLHALPELRKAGAQVCSLEVITKNAVAVRVYERIGFTRMHVWKCFLGRPSIPLAGDGWQERALEEVDLGDDRWYSWDHRSEALQRSMGGSSLFTIGGSAPWGHVVIDPATGRIARLGVSNEHDEDQWMRLIGSLAMFNTSLRLVNVHPDRTALISALLANGLQNDIDQFEMRMPVQ